MKRLLLILPFLAACGPIEVRHTISVEELRQYFNALCADKYPNQPEAIQLCVDLEIGRLLSFLGRSSGQ
jgi:hypothetical protein